VGLLVDQCTSLNYRLPNLETFLNPDEVSTEVNNGSQKDKDDKKERKRKERMEARAKQCSLLHSPARQIILQKLHSYKPAEGKDSNECDGKAKNS
jgi:hypothetical protein